MRANLVGAFAFVLMLAAQAASAQATRETVPGITNLARLDTTIACAGAITPASLADIKRLGYQTVINLRQPTERGADIEGERTAAAAAGVTFVNLPFNSASPDPGVVEQFLTAVTAPENQPVFVHCASGNRAAALWMIKRMVVDGWDGDRAESEAASLGLTSPGLKSFAREYAASHRK
jgi:uncharacterized protein (TIGR01244 family)